MTDSLDFVGSRRDYGNMSDNDNEGHSGWKINDIQGIATSVVSQYRPNIVLLHIGTNDVNGNYQVSSAPDRLSALIDQIYAAAPETALLVSTIIPASNKDTQARIVSYNARVRELVQARANAGKHIQLVEMTSVTTADLSDGLHPNGNGFQKMANAWNDGIKKVLAAGWVKDGGGSATKTIVGAQSKRCLDVKGGSQADGTGVLIWDCSGATNQRWTQLANGGLQVYGGKCLDVLGHATTPGSPVGIWACNGGRNQQWQVKGSTLVSAESGLCLDVSANAVANGSPVAIWTCHGGANQQWQLK